MQPICRCQGICQRIELKEIAANCAALEAGAAAAYESYEQAVKAAKTAISISGGKQPRLTAAFALVWAGDSAKGLNLVREVAQHRPQDVFVQSVWLPVIEAQIELQHGTGVKALEILQPAMPYAADKMGALYTRGVACLKAGVLNEAVKEFQKVLSRRAEAMVGSSVFFSLAQLGLARTYAAMGDKTKARIAYQDLFAIWKDADADLPVLQKAKAEYAKLE
jgi:eukaryotic-like serine/threonine-protein kinase